jgi:predicted RNA-binding Zn-ribbon protein involved in translation (DUF1610 family)
MGNKNVCFDCRKSQNLGSNYENFVVSNCPDCGKKMTLMSNRFRPPKKTNVKEWEVVEFLFNEGFKYQHIYDIEITKSYVPYPTNMKEAKEFVAKYKEQRV